MDRSDYERLVESHREELELKAFILNRFLDYTKFTAVKAGRRGPNDIDQRLIGVVETERDANGWGGWNLNDRQMWEAEDFFIVFHYLEDERAPTMYSDFVKLPKEFVFGELERDAEYAQYLLLKAKFEGGSDD